MNYKYTIINDIKIIEWEFIGQVGFMCWKDWDNLLKIFVI